MARSSRKTTAKRTAKRSVKKARVTSAAALANAIAPAAAAPPPFIVDSHVHTFNASDLSKVGFVTQVLLDSDENAILEHLQPLIKVLVKLMTKAPGFSKEMEYLDGFDSSFSLRSSAALVQAHATERAAVDQEHWEEVAAELERLALSSNGQERALFRAIVDEVHPGGMATFAVAPNANAAGSLVRPLALSNGAIARYLQWVGRLKHYRADIIAELIDTYGQGPNGVTLFASALVDFELWLKDAPQNIFPHQIELGSRLSRTYPGRIHFYAPFDPWREIAATAGKPGSLDLVKRAVMEEGFIGVKLYPPMGFAPLDNGTLDFSAVGVKDSKTFGAGLDAALAKLYAWALKEDVPIIAHCNLSQESKDGFALRASPAYWANVLVKFPGLRLNLGHFGGQGNLGSGSTKPSADWPETIIALMDTAEGTRVYTDIGHFDMKSASWFKALKSAFTTNKTLLSRLMYGSDWMMLATQADYEDYLDLFRKGIAGMKTVTSAQLSAILGENARTFLGLQPGDKPRTRLEQFYVKHGVPLPTWLQ
jgi:predicted TIM-barrel fold metal-dependent hydrolase